MKKVTVTLKVEDAEKARWIEEAGDKGLSEWIRERCNQKPMPLITAQGEVVPKPIAPNVSPAEKAYLEAIAPKPSPPKEAHPNLYRSPGERITQMFKELDEERKKK